MQNGTKWFGIPALAGAAVVLPFVVLEAVTRRGFPEEFPLALVVFMWILAAAFAALLMPVARSRRPLALTAGIAALVVLAWAWGTVVADQMPCFLGVPNCD